MSKHSYCHTRQAKYVIFKQTEQYLTLYSLIPYMETQQEAFRKEIKLSLAKRRKFPIPPLSIYLLI